MQEFESVRSFRPDMVLVMTSHTVQGSALNQAMRHLTPLSQAINAYGPILVSTVEPQPFKTEVVALRSKKRLRPCNYCDGDAAHMRSNLADARSADVNILAPNSVTQTHVDDERIVPSDECGDRGSDAAIRDTQATTRGKVDIGREFSARKWARMVLVAGLGLAVEDTALLPELVVGLASHDDAWLSC
jgi:hypothetical protein